MINMPWLDVLDAAPLLPSLAVARGGAALSWAVVLAALWVNLGHTLPVRARALGALLVLGWSLWPGAASPTYWLGLAFQAPSLTSALCCALWMWWQARQPRGLSPRPAALSTPPRLLWLLAIALGWILLADTLGVWPLSVYAWGFGPDALALVGGTLALLWAVTPTGSRWPLHLLACVLLLFVATRWPSGNLWDAVLDPWLWLILQWRGLHALLRRARQ